MTLPRSAATVLMNQLQQRFVALWLARGSSALPHRRALNHTSTSHRSFQAHRGDTQTRVFSFRSTSASATFVKTSGSTNRPLSTNALLNSTSEARAIQTKRPRKRPKLEWTSEVDAILLDLRTVQHKKWLEIGQHLDREPATCMTRFESTLNPMLKEFWTAERDKQLDTMVTSSKGWPEISETLGVHRLACMERWRQLGLRELAQMDVSKVDEAKRRSKERERREKKHQQEQSSMEQHQRFTAEEQLRNIRETVVNLKVVQPVDKDYDRLSWNSLLRDEQRYSHYRSWKKKTKVDAFSQLYLMNPGWSAKEETVLIQFVLKHGLDQWDVVAKESLKGRFTAAQCRTCWKNLDMPVVTSLNSPDKPSQHSPETSGSSTSSSMASSSSSSTSSAMSTQTPYGKRTEDLTGKVFNYEEESAWTKEQQIQFWHLWNQHGQDWKVIAKTMGGNVSMASCRKYFADITRHFRAPDGTQHQEGMDMDGEEVQERIRGLAKTITQDFKRLPRRPSFSDGDSSAGLAAVTHIPAPSSTWTASTSSLARTPAFIWDKELSVRLQAVIRQAYKSRAIHLDEINWIWVSRRVHPDATSRICKNHWKYLHDSSSSVIWKHEDIKKLEEGIRLLGPKKLSQIRDHFLPHMTKDDIIRHWFRISDKATVIDEEEYYRLLGAVRDLSEDAALSLKAADVSSDGNTEDPQSHHWTEVEKRMGSGWKKMPCKRVWESSFQYLIRHSQWTQNEDNMLLRMVQFVGRDDWYSVAKAMQSGKSPWQCRLRWSQLLDPVDLDTSELFVKGEKYC